MNDEFAAHGHADEDDNGNPIAPNAVLERMADDFEAGEGSQGTALSIRAGATSAIPVDLREGKGTVKIFDAIYHNIYKDDAQMLGAWKTVSHLERTGIATKKPVPPPYVPKGDAASDAGLQRYRPRRTMVRTAAKKLRHRRPRKSRRVAARWLDPRS